MALWRRKRLNETNLLAVNVIQDAGGVRCRVVLLDVGFHPRYEVVLKSALDNLVQDVWREKLVDVCTRKVLSERLLGEASARANVSFHGADR